MGFKHSACFLCFIVNFVGCFANDKIPDTNLQTVTGSSSIISLNENALIQKPSRNISERDPITTTLPANVDETDVVKNQNGVTSITEGEKTVPNFHSEQTTINSKDSAQTAVNSGEKLDEGGGGGGGGEGKKEGEEGGGGKGEGGGGKQESNTKGSDQDSGLQTTSKPNKPWTDGMTEDENGRKDETGKTIKTKKEEDENKTTKKEEEGVVVLHAKPNTFIIVIVDILLSAMVAVAVLSANILEMFLIFLGVFVAAVLILGSCLFLRKHHAVRRIYKVPKKSGSVKSPYPLQLQPQGPPTIVVLDEDGCLVPCSPHSAELIVSADGGPWFGCAAVLGSDAGSRVSEATTLRSRNIYEEIGPRTLPNLRRNAVLQTNLDYLDLIGPPPPPPPNVNVARLSDLPPPSASMLDLPSAMNRLSSLPPPSASMLDLSKRYKINE